MKVCVIQPHYSFDAADVQTCCDSLLDLLEQCDDTLDLIVLPEYSDALADVQGKDGYYEALSIINRLLCYNTNAYLIRASVSLGKDSPVCGCSMVVSPKGEMRERNATLIARYDCELHVYLTSASVDTLKRVRKYAPSLPIFVEWDGCSLPASVLKHAIALGARKIQLSASCLDQEIVKSAHENGVRCSLVYTDSPDRAKAYLEMGVDTLLTEDCLTLANIIKA